MALSAWLPLWPWAQAELPCPSNTQVPCLDPAWALRPLLCVSYPKVMPFFINTAVRVIIAAFQGGVLFRFRAAVFQVTHCCALPSILLSLSRMQMWQIAPGLIIAGQLPTLPDYPGDEKLSATKECPGGDINKCIHLPNLSLIQALWGVQILKNARSKLSAIPSRSSCLQCG